MQGTVITNSCVFNRKGLFKDSNTTSNFLVRECRAYRIERVYVLNEVVYTRKEKVRYMKMMSWITEQLNRANRRGEQKGDGTVTLPIFSSW